MRAGSVFGNYLKATDLGGRKVPVRIESCAVAEFDDGKKIVLSFAGKDKKLAVNLTNSNTITEILGTDETDEWVGHTIVLYSTKVQYGAKMVDGIRVEAFMSPKQAPPPTRKPAPPPVEYDENPEAENFHASDDDVPF